MNTIKIPGIIKGLDPQDMKTLERLCKNKKVPTKRISVNNYDRDYLVLGNAVKKLESVEKKMPDKLQNVIKESAYWVDTKPNLLKKLESLRPKAIPGLWAARNVDDKVLNKLEAMFEAKGIPCKKLFIPNVYEGYSDRFIAFGDGLKKANNLIELFNSKKVGFKDVETVFHKSPALAGKKTVLELANKFEMPAPVIEEVIPKKTNIFSDLINRIKGNKK